MEPNLSVPRPVASSLLLCLHDVDDLPIVREPLIGSEAARKPGGHAGLRPPLKLHVRFSRMQLSRRLSFGMQEKELT